MLTSTLTRTLTRTKRSITSIAVLMLLVVSLARFPAAAQSAPELILPAVSVGFSFVQQASGGDSFFHVQLSGVGMGYDVADGEAYLAWCVDPNSGDELSAQGQLYSSYLADLPQDIRLYNDLIIPWDQINWLLNHKTGLPNTVVNPAIWYLITGERDHYTSDWFCPEGSACDNLAAQAQLDGDGFVPQAGQVIAVILRLNGISPANDHFQDTILEVAVPGGITPTPTETQTPTATLTPTPTSTPTETPTPTVTPTVVTPRPEIDLRKQAEGPDSRTVASGASVSFEILVTNRGNVPITNLVVTDAQAPECSQSLPYLAPGDSWVFTCTVTGVAQTFTNIATVSGQSGGVEVSDSDPSTVVVPGSRYFLYIPALWNPPLRFNLTLGYEDLPLSNTSLDYDFNDFNASIETIFTTATGSLYLQKIDFVITPNARGGLYSHALHLRFPANSFGSDGTATLTLKDGTGQVVSAVKQPFVASQANDYTVIPSSADAFPGREGVVNAVEGTPFRPSQRMAQLTFEFNTPVPANLIMFDESRIEVLHGAGLFFDPYLHVYNTGQDIHQGDHRMISAPGEEWPWPEEGVRIDRAYTAISGTPPNEVFPVGWWSVHNTCVYGDGIVCR